MGDQSDRSRRRSRVRSRSEQPSPPPPPPLPTRLLEVVAAAGGKVPSAEFCQQKLTVEQGLRLPIGVVRGGLDELIASGELVRSGPYYELARARGPELVTLERTRQARQAAEARMRRQQAPSRALERKLEQAEAEVLEAKRDALTWRSVARDLTERVQYMDAQIRDLERVARESRNTAAAAERPLRMDLADEQERRQRDVRILEERLLEQGELLRASEERLGRLEAHVVRIRRAARSGIAAVLVLLSLASAATPFLFDIDRLVSTLIGFGALALIGVGAGIRFGRVSTRIGAVMAAVSAVAAIYYLLSVTGR